MTAIELASVIWIRAGERYPWHRYARPFVDASCGLPMPAIWKLEDHEVTLDPELVGGDQCVVCTERQG